MAYILIFLVRYSIHTAARSFNDSKIDCKNNGGSLLLSPMETIWEIIKDPIINEYGDRWYWGRGNWFWTGITSSGDGKTWKWVDGGIVQDPKTIKNGDIYQCAVNVPAVYPPIQFLRVGQSCDREANYVCQYTGMIFISFLDIFSNLSLHIVQRIVVI